MSPPDLRSREHWRSALHPKTGEKVEDVIESSCGTFTIHRTWRGISSRKSEIFMAWRRRPRPQTADLIGGYESAAEARDACARYLERATA